jgi:hypothetical protein
MPKFGVFRDYLLRPLYGATTALYIVELTLKLENTNNLLSRLFRLKN